MTALQEQQLGQSRPSNTSAASIYSTPSNITTIVKTIYICNTSAGSATFRIFFDNDGTTYDESTALFWDVSVDANSTLELNTFIAMNNSSGNVAIQTGTANALTFTLFGAQIT